MPLGPVPPFVVALLGHCNRKSSQQLWEEYNRLYEYLVEVGLVHLLGPYIGNGTDGDVRCRIIALARMLNRHSDASGNSGSRFRGVEHPSFVLSGLLQNFEGASFPHLIHNDSMDPLHGR